MQFKPYAQDFVDHIRAGGADAYGKPAEHAVSDGVAKPCRSCLCNIAEGAPMLILAARPFPEAQPYAETGPIFLCADACTPYSEDAVPPVLKTSPDYLMKAYTADHRIAYGTGQITPASEIESYAASLFERADLAYIDVRSARNNCFLARIPRDG